MTDNSDYSLMTAKNPEPTQLASSIPTGATPSGAGDAGHWENQAVSSETGAETKPSEAGTEIKSSETGTEIKPSPTGTEIKPSTGESDPHVVPSAEETAAAVAAAVEAVRSAKPCNPSEARGQDIEDDEEMSKLRAQGLTADLIERKKLKMGAPKHLWIAEEDIILASAVAKLGEKCWSEIAVLLPGRVGKQCRDRWRNHLCPFVKKGSWTEREDQLLFYHHQQLGNQWAEIAKHIPGRTDLSVKNRYYSYLRKINRQMTRSAKDLANRHARGGTLFDHERKALHAMTTSTGTEQLTPSTVKPEKSNAPADSSEDSKQNDDKSTSSNRHDPVNGISPELQLAYKKILGGLATKAPEPLPQHVGSYGSTLVKHLGDSTLGRVAARAKEVVEQAVASKQEREAAKKRKKEAKIRNAAAKRRKSTKKPKGLTVQTKASQLGRGSTSAIGVLTSLLSANNEEDALESAIAGLTDLATPNAKAAAKARRAAANAKSRKNAASAANNKKKTTKKGKKADTSNNSSSAADLLLGLAQGLGPGLLSGNKGDLFSPMNLAATTAATSGITSATPKNVEQAKAKVPVDSNTIHKRAFTSPAASGEKTD